GPIGEPDFDEKLSLAVELWAAVAENMPEWGKVKSGDLKPFEVRQEYIHTHAVVLWAIGAMSQTLMSTHADWRERLVGLRDIDWRRTNKEWQGIAMSGHDVVNRRQSRSDTASFLKLKFGLTLTPAEERSLKGATDVPSIMNELRQFVDL